MRALGSTSAAAARLELEEDTARGRIRRAELTSRKSTATEQWIRRHSIERGWQKALAAAEPAHASSDIEPEADAEPAQSPPLASLGEYGCTRVLAAVADRPLIHTLVRAVAGAGLRALSAVGSSTAATLAAAAEKRQRLLRAAAIRARLEPGAALRTLLKASLPGSWTGLLLVPTQPAAPEQPATFSADSALPPVQQAMAVAREHGWDCPALSSCVAAAEADLPYLRAASSGQEFLQQLQLIHTAQEEDDGGDSESQPAAELSSSAAEPEPELSESCVGFPPRRYDLRWLCGVCDATSSAVPPKMAELRAAMRPRDIISVLALRHPRSLLAAIAAQPLLPQPPPPPSPPKQSRVDALRRRAARKAITEFDAGAHADARREAPYDGPWLGKLAEAKARRRAERQHTAELQRLASVESAEAARQELATRCAAARRGSEVSEASAADRIRWLSGIGIAREAAPCGGVRRHAPGAVLPLLPVLPPCKETDLNEQEAKERRTVHRVLKDDWLALCVAEQKSEQAIHVARLRVAAPRLVETEAAEASGRVPIEAAEAQCRCDARAAQKADWCASARRAELRAVSECVGRAAELTEGLMGRWCPAAARPASA
eukprot:TRINITY_DN17179_c0_g1_i1.p1 TRINITY_DN17179_c0_g1~~TRINITY_DN17179_c0_g1_i1.p1  ORF type:complete len:605 (+),score=161.71 TRINITY_DN17179_c0_g1_i1:56-1870(+)